jgi:hypothetical protein
MRFLIGVGGNLALKASAPMDAGVPGHELVNLVQDRAQRRRTGGVVKSATPVCPLARLAVEYLLVHIQDRERLP